jgi:glycosyltransferase involved in cell wall biosynthesis
MAHKRRIVFLCSTYPPVPGGVAKHVAEMARCMLKADFEAYVLTRQVGDAPAEEVLAGVRIRRISTDGRRVFANIYYVFKTLFFTWKIKPDIVHSHELHLPSVAGVVIKTVFRIPLVVTIHTQGPLIGDIAVVKRAFLGRMRLAIFRKFVDCFISISNQLDMELEDAGIPLNKRVSIPNGIDMDRFSPVEETVKYQLRQKLLLPHGQIVIYSGRLVWEKRVHNLLEVWPGIRQKFPTAWLLIVGSGEYEEEFRRSSADGVILVGEVSDAATYIQASDLMVIPSIYEGFSLSALEGLACGLSVVATPVGAIPQLISHPTTGWIVPVDDLPSLQSAILTLLEDPLLRQEMGRKGREAVSQNYSLEMLTEKLASMYMRLMRQSA